MRIYSQRAIGSNVHEQNKNVHWFIKKAIRCRVPPTQKDNEQALYMGAFIV